MHFSVPCFIMYSLIKKNYVVQVYATSSWLTKFIWIKLVHKSVLTVRWSSTSVTDVTQCSTSLYYICATCTILSKFLALWLFVSHIFFFISLPHCRYLVSTGSQWPLPSPSACLASLRCLSSQPAWSWAWRSLILLPRQPAQDSSGVLCMFVNRHSLNYVQMPNSHMTCVCQSV